MTSSMTSRSLPSGADAELAMDDLRAAGFDPADRPRRRWPLTLSLALAFFIEGSAEQDDLLAVERRAALPQRHPRLAGVRPDAGEPAGRSVEAR